MTTPRLHAELAALYFADDTLKCWARNMDSNDDWSPMDSPAFNNPGFEYYVGHEPPPPIKRTITLTVNGREWVLPEPIQGPFHLGRTYYVGGADGRPSLRAWMNADIDNFCQANLRMSDTKDDCRAWAEFDKWCRGGGA